MEEAGRGGGVEEAARGGGGEWKRPGVRRGSMGQEYPGYTAGLRRRSHSGRKDNGSW